MTMQQEIEAIMTWIEPCLDPGLRAPLRVKIAELVEKAELRGAIAMQGAAREKVRGTNLEPRIKDLDPQDVLKVAHSTRK